MVNIIKPLTSDLDNLFRLRVFLEVADSRSFSRAAARLFLSQPAVSNHIKHLERSFGAALFESRMRNLILTEAGHSLYDAASQLVSLRDEVASRLSGKSGMVEGHVVVEADGTWEYFLPEILAAFRLEHPKVLVTLRISSPREVYDAVLHNGVSLGFASLPPIDARIEVLLDVAYQTNMMVIASRDHPVLQRKAPLAPQILEQYPFIFYPAQESGTYVTGFLETLGVKPTYALELASVAAIKKAVARGAGISLLAEVALRDDLENGRLAQIPLAAPPLRWSLVAAHKRSRSLSNAESALITAIKTSFPAPGRIQA